MALQSDLYSDVPKNSVILTETEAVKYQSYIIKNWHKPSEVYPLLYGNVVLGGGALISAIYINNHFRRKFKLIHYGRAASYLPICAIPAAITFMTHTEFVLKKLVLMDFKTCPVCLEVRSAAIQAIMGVGFPLVVAPIGSMALVHRYFTVNIPSISNEPRKVLQLLQQHIKPIKNVLLGMAACQAVLGMAITYLEAKAVLKINEELSKNTEIEMS